MNVDERESVSQFLERTERAIDQSALRIERSLMLLDDGGATISKTGGRPGKLNDKEPEHLT